MEEDKKNKVEKVYQLLHKKDNGELVLCSINNSVNIICKNCKTLWMLNIPFEINISDDFVKYKDWKKKMNENNR